MGVVVWRQGGLEIRVKVVPRASREKIVGLHGESLKIALTAPPVEGAANQALCQFLAGEFKVAKGRVSILRGERSREKVVRIEAPDPKRLAAFLDQWQLPKLNPSS
ncbi:MAG: YggU family protein [Magnetococcales bacterium]|nr:YggU family protein [Magnetococcales bacterium]